MMAADSLRFIVPSGVSSCWRSPCRRAYRANASAPPVVQHPAALSPCKHLALNAPGQWSWPRSPARWLRAAQHRRAADARSDSEGQRRKAR